jgi:hypothetical protein
MPSRPPHTVHGKSVRTRWQREDCAAPDAPEIGMQTVTLNAALLFEQVSDYLECSAARRRR